MAKTEGYDGGSSDDNNVKQWNFPGALLYSVTVITTIGYGNIAPKTSWGRIVTIVYAIFGMPLFLMWASQMGTFLARTFTFFYSNICCIVCKRGKRKKALRQRMQEKEKFDEMIQQQQIVKQQLMQSQVTKEKSIPQESTLTKPKLDLINQLRMRSAMGDSGLQSQQSLDKNSAKVDIMDEGVKELLTTCAKYNLDQGVSGMEGGYSAEILEEIRHAEAMETIRNKSTNGSAPTSPSKSANLGVPGSPSPLPRPHLSSLGQDSVINSAPTPQAVRRAKMGHPTVVSVSADGNGTAVTSLMSTPTGTLVTGNKSPPPYRDVSPSVSLQVNNTVNDGASSINASSDREDSSVIKVSVQQKIVDRSSVNQDRVPMLPVLGFVAAYILLGAGLFSSWEGWDFLEGAYFCFITLTTIGFGDFVPGDAVLNLNASDGQPKLIIACMYVLMGLAIVAMSINLVQEEIIGKFRKLAKDMGIIEEDEDELSN